MKEGGYRLSKPSKSNRNLSDGLVVSIITVVYNGESYLEHTIQSVLNQTYKNIEYIIVDGGSTDNTLEIIKKHEDKVAYWRSEPDKGISDAFNKGIAFATGDLIGIINADDWYEPDAVSSVVAKYKPGIVLHGNLQYWKEDGSRGMNVSPNANLLKQEMTINHPTVFIDKEVYHKLGSFDTSYKFAMDYHLLLRILHAGVPFIYVNKTLANMRLGGFSSNWIDSYRETKRAKEEILKPSLKHHAVYLWQVLRRRASESMENSPLSFINEFYRRHFSPMRKM
ncbi:glycosyltransferase family 2 protein [Pontibacter toksunensis]|uniref:Glycosyltransferase family 2 protein n=1 Tax=Pontibacter toksunensis TaxID=1332631 RepID=A0ABW6BR09_9BACT